jgi:predicted DsbA family dithiol-disulfide isomerase
MEFRDHVTIRHRAFQLQPDAIGIVPTKKLLADKYGASLDQVNQMQADLCAIADGEGLCYQLNDTLSGNTLDAHRLLLWAATVGKQDELLETLYSNYFEKSLPVFEHSDLVSAALAVGIDADKSDDLLTSNKYNDDVIADRNLASQLGATGVPFFVFDMKFGISGAQPGEIFTQTLMRAWQDEQLRIRS